MELPAPSRRERVCGEPSGRGNRSAVGRVLPRQYFGLQSGPEWTDRERKITSRMEFVLSRSVRVLPMMPVASWVARREKAGFFASTLPWQRNCIIPSFRQAQFILLLL